MLTNSIALQGQQFQKQTQQLTEGILVVKQSVDSTNVRIETEITPQIDALKEENEKLHSEKEYLRRRLIEHEAQAAEEAEGHKRRQLFNKIGELGRIEIRLLGMKHPAYWERHRRRYGHKLSGEPPSYNECLATFNDMAERIKVYLSRNPNAIDKLKDDDKNFLLVNGAWGNFEGSSIPLHRTHGMGVETG